MPTIPVIPGVSVATMGILNKPIKDIICAILFGGFKDMLKGNLLCIKLDIAALLELPNLHADLKTELDNLQKELDAAQKLLGIGELLGRINKGIAEVQSLLALNGLCNIPLRAPLIPDILKQSSDLAFGQMNSILQDLGRLSKPQLCLTAGGQFNTGTYNSNSIFASMKGSMDSLGNIPTDQINMLLQRLRGVQAALRASVNRQLFPDFRHTHILAPGIILASAAEQQQLHASILASDSTNLAAWQLTANMLNATAAQIAATYPPPDTPNLKDAINLAQELVSLVDNTASYPADVNGIRHENMWPSILGPEMYGLAVQALTPEDSLFVQQDPVYDYCGKLVGQTSTVITGDPGFAGGDPTVGAELTPPVTNFNFIWIQARQCWAVSGVEREQIVAVGGNNVRGLFLDANPTIKILRGYNHILGIPSYDGATLAPEFYICKVGTDLTPLLAAGIIVPFNLGLARLETGELLVDANGTIGIDAANGLDGIIRRTENPLGTTMYFAAGHSVYTGATPPFAPDPSVWWNARAPIDPDYIDFEYYKWVVDDLTQTGSWAPVLQVELDENFVGSSTTIPSPNDHTANYLAYSNIDGSSFGLFELV